jgi:hypothetical protein
MVVRSHTLYHFVYGTGCFPAAAVGAEDGTEAAVKGEMEAGSGSGAPA